MMKKIYLYPFLFALYPVVTLYSHNISKIPFVETFRITMISLAIAAGLYWLFGNLVKDWQRSALAVSALALLFFTFGHVQEYLNLYLSTAAIVRIDILAAIWAAGMILLPWIILRLLKRGLIQGLTVFMRVTSIAAIAFPLINIVGYWMQNGLMQENSRPLVTGSKITSSVDSENAPDIYYIVVDTYGRQDVLEDLFGENQRAFLDFLRKRGFVVAEESRANYSQTLLSMGSSLNMDYLERLGPVDIESENRLPLYGLVGQNEAERYLKARGYRTVFIASNFFAARGMAFDEFLSPLGKGITTFERLLLEGSLARIFLDQVPAGTLRDAYRESLEMLTEQADGPGPKFVVYYTMLLHAPYLYDRDGNPIEPLGRINYSPPQVFQEGYAGQLAYANTVLREAIEEILAKSPRPPVIVIQGDHGPAVLFDYGSLEANTCLRERYAIMNAYYLPGAEDAVYDSITPVNTFRVIFNEYLGADFELLPDRSYYSTWEKPYKFTDITDWVEECPPLDKR